MPIRSALITVMERAVRKAGSSLRRDFGEVEQLQVSRKGPADFVSAADQKAERVLKEELKRARPDFGFLMEESGEEAGSTPEMPRWIVDPLDGTTNFLHGIPHYGISVALEEHGEIIAGVVYNPLTDETFWAEKGKGAWLGERRLRVSGRQDLRQSVVATGIPYHGHGEHDRFSAILSAVMKEVAGVRRFGAASLDLAYVAAGRFDAFWEDNLQPWDMAAGILLIREAGGFVSDFRGGDQMLKTGDIVAGNATLQSRLHRVIGQAIKSQRG